MEQKKHSERGQQEMNKKTIIIMNSVVIVVWLATIIINLLSEDISKFSYGACGFILIFSWVLRTADNIRICELYDHNIKLLQGYVELLKTIFKKEEEQ